MNRGIPPTAPKARTGLLTPPGSRVTARSNNRSDVTVSLLDCSFRGSAAIVRGSLSWRSRCPPRRGALSPQRIHLGQPVRVARRLTQQEEQLRRGNAPPGLCVGESRVIDTEGLEPEAKLAGAPESKRVAPQHDCRPQRPHAGPLSASAVSR